MLKQDRTIIHVEIKDTHEHFYFGSSSARGCSAPLTTKNFCKFPLTASAL